MSDDSIQVNYNVDLEPLEKLLSGVRRPGNFFVAGSKEIPMPKIEIQDVGILSFPVSGDQAQKVIEQAARAPFGRGEKTILDTSVRKVWQLPSEKVQIGGASWPTNFNKILSEVHAGLGCQDVKITAVLYKMLVYDVGGFFLSHRDTEKAPGMFGTLVVVLPSLHSGGELIIRHSGHEACVDLSDTETSEVSYVAFYADCEHEVRPVTKGNRICLVYNLIQEVSKNNKSKAEQLLCPSLYNSEVAEAAGILEKALTDKNAPAKIAWLFEHQYSPAELSFSKLKNADAARAKFLVQAATRSGCAVHLAMIHLEESGSAEAGYGYDSYSRGSRRGYYERYNDDDEDENEDDEEYDDDSCYDDDDFEVIDIDGREQYVDGWKDLQGNSVAYGRLPLEDGELLPQGSLDDEEPDEKRLMEATGNEGASFERAYHRAALVIWRHERYAQVLLQGGTLAAMPHFKKCVEAALAEPSGSKMNEARAVGSSIVNHWIANPQYSSYWNSNTFASRAEMLRLLISIEEAALLESLIDRVVFREYDGQENADLVQAIQLLDKDRACGSISRLIRFNMSSCPGSCVNLLLLLTREEDNRPSTIGRENIERIAIETVVSLKTIGKKPQTPDFIEDWREKKGGPVEPTLVIDLWEALQKLDADQLRFDATAEIISRPTVFDPEKILTPALCRLHEQYGDAISSDANFVRLWQHAGEFLLARNEYPPELPKDWYQEVKITCKCEDCKDLQKFVSDPKERIHRFRVRQDRRRHLHNIINSYKLDMTHETERVGSPQTLVCTKTRRGYEVLCNQHRIDAALMRSLIPLVSESHQAIAGLRARLASAVSRVK